MNNLDCFASFLRFAYLKSTYIPRFYVDEQAVCIKDAFDYLEQNGNAILAEDVKGKLYVPFESLILRGVMLFHKGCIAAHWFSTSEHIAGAVEVQTLSLGRLVRDPTLKKTISNYLRIKRNRPL